MHNHIDDKPPIVAHQVPTTAPVPQPSAPTRTLPTRSPLPQPTAPVHEVDGDADIFRRPRQSV
jgi:hypothetical protein